jgi:hypothetical protein
LDLMSHQLEHHDSQLGSTKERPPTDNAAFLQVEPLFDSCTGRRNWGSRTPTHTWTCFSGPACPMRPLWRPRRRAPRGSRVGSRRVWPSMAPLVSHTCSAWMGQGTRWDQAPFRYCSAVGCDELERLLVDSRNSESVGTPGRRSGDNDARLELEVALRLT